MHLIDGSKGKIRCDDGEQITVVVAPNAGVAAVRYSLDGKKWGGGSFPVNQANPPHPPTAPRYGQQRRRHVGHQRHAGSR
ncbi:MAG: hypothetical protein LC774_11020 [Acidobacteria bacterium]|nr:hypothetical protein [Acidobacteriota bacterium]